MARWVLVTQEQRDYLDAIDGTYDPALAAIRAIVAAYDAAADTTSHESSRTDPESAS